MPTENHAEPKTVRTLIESQNFQSAIANVLPTHLTPARFVRIAIAATTRTPKLQECDPNTVLQCLITLSQFGLEPDGRNAHLIPFWNSQRKTFECQLIIDYKGLAALAKRSGQVSYVHADAVCEKDDFEYNKGVVVKHEVNFKEDRGKPYCYYAMVRFKDGTEQADCMTRVEVDRIRARSRAKDSGPWVTDYDEMAKKTVFRRLSKWLELSPEFRDAIEADADALEELRFENALPITRPKIKTLKNREPKSEPARTTPAKEPTPPTETEEPAVIAEKMRGISQFINPAAPPKKLKKKEQPAPIKPKEAEVLKLLADMGKTKDDLVAVVKVFNVLKDDEGWNDIDEKGFDELLFPDNWNLIKAELDNTTKKTL